MANKTELLHFKTEYLSNPLAVENRTPRFSWQFPPGVTYQKTYRVTVGSTPGASDMWDSGITESAQSVGVCYAGKPLRSHSRYYVNCVSTDREGREHRSKESTFETALYDEKDWKGSWVSVPVNFAGGTLLFRKIIEIAADKKITRARAYVCGIGYHELFVNGVKKGNALLEPGISEYAKRVYYVAYDLDDLRPGKNVFAVEVGYGWLGARKLLAQIYVEYSDGSVYEDHTGPGWGWWVGGSPTTENSVYGGETFDARLSDTYPVNWNTLDFEPTWANGWMYTIHTSPPAGKLQSQEIQPITVGNIYPEVKRTEKSNGVYVVDVGANIAGRLRIKVQGERGARVTLKFAEDLDANGFVNRINLRSAKCTDTYVLRGDGVEEFAPRFTYHGFRYVQVEITGNARLMECVGEHMYTSADSTGEFNCSDGILNRLHEIAVRTERNNEHSILSDCPQRDERFGWLNDLSSRIYQTMYNVDMSRFIPKFLRDIADTQTAEGAIADTAPYYTGGIPADPVCVIYELLADYAYRYYGDTVTVATEYDGIKKWVEFLLSHADGYIMDYSYYADWVCPFEGVKADNIFVSSAFLYWHLKEMVRLARIVCNKADEKKYAAHLQGSRKALNEKYFNKETDSYCLGTQTENALAVSLGFAPEDRRAAIAETIYRDAVKRNHHCTSGNVGYRHVFYVLAQYGHADEVVNILRNPEYPGWGYMIKSGATSVWERWEAEMQNEMHSFNHPMYGSYDAFLYAFLAGIQVDEDAVACDKITVAPVFVSGLDYACGFLETVHGRVLAKWTRVCGKIKLHVEVPPQTQVTLKAGSADKTLHPGVYDFTL